MNITFISIIEMLECSHISSISSISFSLFKEGIRLENEGLYID